MLCSLPFPWAKSEGSELVEQMVEILIAQSDVELEKSHEQQQNNVIN